ncbi:MAG: 16S rRNA (cytosine(1402)-N(4))-methyltransferase RsmH, partial [Solirubrobacterales bacterium]|nr:16S rRNA (cytosine(1402)-N(4))-methyltransferase RsmH [Solirubrobacterales bacterium]
RFIRADFVSALGRLEEEGVEADLAYLDLGMSSMQVDTWERGFSYAYDAPLDMRMGPEQEVTARQIVNEWDERRLARLLREYGEERYASRIARAIVRTRDRAEIDSTQQLVEVIKGAVPVPAQFAGGHPARRTFQALRIAVNDELCQLDAALPAAWRVLRPGGRFAAISFHSLEDRRVKRFLSERARGCVCPPELPVCVCGRHPEAELLTRRAVTPTAGEIEANPRSKSAHLRAARKLEAATQ